MKNKQATTPIYIRIPGWMNKYGIVTNGRDWHVILNDKKDSFKWVDVTMNYEIMNTSFLEFKHSPGLHAVFKNWIASSDKPIFMLIE